MQRSRFRRRDVLLAVSGGCLSLAGCTDDEPAGEATNRSAYGVAYGASYGAE